MADGHDRSSAAAVGVISVIAIIGSLGGLMLAINRPMAQRIDQLERMVTNMVGRMESDDQRERMDAATLAHLASEGNAEQSAIRKLEAAEGLGREWMQEHDLRVRGLNAAQSERLRALERVVFNQRE